MSSPISLEILTLLSHLRTFLDDSDIVPMDRLIALQADLEQQKVQQGDGGLKRKKGRKIICTTYVSITEIKCTVHSLELTQMLPSLRRVLFISSHTSPSGTATTRKELVRKAAGHARQGWKRSDLTLLSL